MNIDKTINNTATIIIPPTKEELDIAAEQAFYKSTNLKVCIFCGSNYSYGQRQSKFCGLCKIKYSCPVCKKEVIKTINDKELPNRKMLLQKIKENKLEEYFRYCSYKCSSKSRTLPGICIKCKKYVDKRNGAFLCSNCSSLSGPGICTTCMKYSNIRNNCGQCSECFDRSKLNKCIKCKKKSDKLDALGICLDCQLKTRSGRGICSKCGKKSENRNWYNLCPDCFKKDGFGKCLKCGQKSKLDVCGICTKCKIGPGLCYKCNKHSEKRDITGLCKKCRSEITLRSNKINSSPGECRKCNKYSEKRSITGLCKDCSFKVANNFDREKFYNSKLSLISFKSSDNIISLDDIDSLNNIPGVWSIWSSDNKCLDVCQTINIGKEMLGWIRNYNACKDKTDEELIEMNRIYQSYNRIKKRDIADYCKNLNSKPIFKLVSININDKTERENIEAQYAHNNKSIFWNPAPNQKLS